MSTAATTSAVRLNAATITQYLVSQSGSSLTPGKRRAVLLRAAPAWDSPAELPWGDQRQARVAAAPSPLAVYELVLRHLAPGTPGPDVLVVLTDREEAELGPDLLAKVHKQRVNAVEAWDVVREAFGAGGDPDGRLFDENWAAEALLDATPPGGWPQRGGGMLSRGGALKALAMRRLGIGRYDPDRDPREAAAAPDADVLDVPALFRWSLVTGGPERYLALRAPERTGLARFLGEEEQAGAAGRALLALVEAEHGPDAVAFGLVCAALWKHAAESADVEDYRARGRAERWFGEEPPARGAALDALAASFGRSCEEFVSGLLLAGRSGDDEAASAARRLTGSTLDHAALLVRQFGAERAARTSPVLADGLEARFADAGRALAGKDAEPVVRSVKALRKHRLAHDTDAVTRIARAGMAQRLWQWLATEPPAESPAVAAGAGPVEAAIGRHVTETGWVDLALDHIEAGGDPDPVLKAAYDRLCVAVCTRRREIDRHFARALATWTEGGNDPGTMLTVETFLPVVVAPVVKAGARRVLLLVLDGMSAAIAAELGEELREHWVEYDPHPKAKGAPRRRGMAAGLPTVTAVSRTSLFAARRMSGTQADEKRLFPTHTFWGEEEVAVFHKDDLRGESGGAPFGAGLFDALAGDLTHVAVVLNTIDDRLAAEQKLGDGTWRLGDIGQLRELLRFAAVQGRAVILTSDHGHVVDRHGARITAEGVLSARHRESGQPGKSGQPGEPGASLAETEVLLHGERVVAPETGGRIVALWDADSRYTAQKAGYHGGASLAEFAIPVLAFLPFGAEPPKGWRELGGQQPAWWSLAPSAPSEAQQRPGAPGTADTSSAPVQKKAGKRTKKESELARSHEALFDVELAPSAEGDGTLLTPQPVSPDDDLVSRLLTSEVFAAQWEMLTRKPTALRVEKAVHALLDVGGTLPVTALGQRIGLPAGQNPAGFAAVLRQLLNHDGVQVLETLPDGRTLRLNVGSLREQFELG
ncbi:BREX-2 system phosphatase PglZ [Streptomyces sp. NPDC058470]|uniref:BREX-2 system phosphatase PglZ n=1 Tax=Streptomyces sp. NPDC058470 TaxID=3346515 RepID=UPI00364C5E16